jgi:hypothetical protein
MAILFVTVFVVDADTAVEAKTFPVAAGRVSVKFDAVEGGVRVTDPPPEDESLISPMLLCSF